MWKFLTKLEFIATKPALLKTKKPFVVTKFHFFKMSEIITLQLPETLAQKAKEIAAFTHRSLEDVLIEWINRASHELPVESLPDEQVLNLCDLQMESQQQEFLSDLLARQREGLLNEIENSQLDELMQVYRRGLVRKAQALKVAVERGLIPAIN
ncbi:MAG: hypothetical protein VKL60_09695 [Sphaerospermopsis sp.]|uniref:hypothetical protein n=1 Tax=Sphaerospermopsis sp. LEGE 00249 TaxID=1380707 RepID=UPI00210773E6|nr:hypothetical protein [Sphaerospermopsis sp. LEGE 00249]MEB3149286.1 hypothetical protein [Sphaerospermopsis sp.]